MTDKSLKHCNKTRVLPAAGRLGLGLWTQRAPALLQPGSRVVVTRNPGGRLAPRLFGFVLYAARE